MYYFFFTFNKCIEYPALFQFLSNWWFEMFKSSFWVEKAEMIVIVLGVC